MSGSSYFDPLQYGRGSIQIGQLYLDLKPGPSKPAVENISYFWVSCQFGAVQARPMRAICGPKAPDSYREQDRTAIDHSARSDVLRRRRAHIANSSINAFASFRSRVSKPSVNQP